MADERRTQHIQGSASGGKAPSIDDLPTQMVGSKSQTVVGQLEIVKGPGAGARLPVYAGTNALGREPHDNRLVVDFGDTMIGRKHHVFITHDQSARVFGIQGNGHPNPVLLNGATVTKLVRVVPGDRIEIGQTTFQLLA